MKTQKVSGMSPLLTSVANVLGVLAAILVELASSRCMRRSGWSRVDLPLEAGPSLPCRVFGRGGEEAVTARFFGMLGIIGVAALAAGVLVLASLGTPARAAFPGTAGAIAFDANRDGVDNVYRMNGDGFGQTKLTDTPGSNAWPSWSSDGKRIAFTNVQSGNPEIYMMDSDGSNETNLTKHPAKDWGASWFPQGNKIAFTSERTGDGDIYAMTFDAAGHAIETTRLTTSAARDFHPNISPDGKKIAFVSLRDGGSEIYVMKVAREGSTNRPIKLTDNDNFVDDDDPDWSPGGTRIVFHRQDLMGRNEIFVMNADGTGKANLTRNPAVDIAPAFSPDGKKIAFWSNRQDARKVDIWRMSSDGSNPVQLTIEPVAETLPWRPRPPSWQPLP